MDIYHEPSDFVNSGGSQSGPGLHDREKTPIAAIGATRDRAKMSRYDGPPNSQNLTKRGITWKRKPDIERGVLCGCDTAQEWLLPWWWERYSSCNSYPVLFCDFGMSDKARAWCQERGQVISVSFDEACIKPRKDMSLKLQELWSKKGEAYWASRASLFKKPFAMLESPFTLNIWLDLDCEVLSSLDDLFAYSLEAPLALCECGILRSELLSGPPAHNGGVVVFHHGITIFMKQAEWILEWNHHFYAEDSVLSYLIHQMNFPIVLLPKEWNWLIGNYGVNLLARIAHWNLDTKKLLQQSDGIKPLRDSLLGRTTDQTPTSAQLRASAFEFK